MDLKDKVIKLRCVQVKKSGDHWDISLTNLSSCLIIREWFYDARHLRKSVGKELPKSEAGQTKGYLPLKKDFISTVKQIHESNKPLTVSALNKKLSAPDSVGKVFVVEGNVLGLIDTDPQNVIKIVDQNSKIHSLAKPPKGDNHHYVINLALTLNDLSAKDQTITVYLTTSEEEGHPFDQWKVIPKI